MDESTLSPSECDATIDGLDTTSDSAAVKTPEPKGDVPDALPTLTETPVTRRKGILKNSPVYSAALKGDRISPTCEVIDEDRHTMVLMRSPTPRRTPTPRLLGLNGDVEIYSERSPNHEFSGVDLRYRQLKGGYVQLG